MTWAEVPIGTVIEGWTLKGRTPVAGTDQVRLAMTGPDGTLVPVVRRADEPAPVTVVVTDPWDPSSDQVVGAEQAPISDPGSDVKQNSDDRDPFDDAHQAAATAALSEQMEVEELASETTDEQRAREAATAADPLVLPPITAALSLRSHLYLVHGADVSSPPEGPDPLPWLEERHREGHDVGPMAHPHLHREPAR